MTNNAQESAQLIGKVNGALTAISLKIADVANGLQRKFRSAINVPATEGERGDVPGWVLVVLMTTGLVMAIWTIAAPKLSTILRNSLDSMNAIR